MIHYLCKNFSQIRYEYRVLCMTVDFMAVCSRAAAHYRAAVCTDGKSSKAEIAMVNTYIHIL